MTEYTGRHLELPLCLRIELSLNIITYFNILIPFEKLDKIVLEQNTVRISFHHISSHLILKIISKMIFLGLSV